MPLSTFTRRAMLLAASPMLLASPAQAQDVRDDDEQTDTDTEIVIVTGTRIRQGGAQDVAHFRSISLDNFQQGLPRADSLTLEGLLGEHDLTLPATDGCEQLFCIDTHVMPADMLSRTDDTQFLGIGFASNVDEEAYRAQPVSLVAVVDRSGSMSNAPIARVKEGLHAVIDALREGDRMGIVIYGSETLVHQQVIDVEGNREELHHAVDAIRIDGSTFMEAGLQLGYKVAFGELENSNGRTRLMLFTDENPNVGNTSPEGFMGQALAGSRRGVGLTTIGVAQHFDARLATRISSVRGGNLFFLPREGSGRELFEREFTSMISEVAHDLAISIDPAPGYRVTGVYGVPGDLITDGVDGTVTVSIGSAFLSSNGGGIYATLAGEGSASAPVAEVSVAYTSMTTQSREYDAESVLQARGEPAENLATAQLLVDQYFGITQALSAYHERKDAREAAELLAALSERIEDAELTGMESEQELVNSLRNGAEQLAGMSGRTQPWELFGEWRVVRHERVSDISRGDRVEITEYGEFITERMRGRDAGEIVDQSFALNERQLHIVGSGLVLDYRISGDRLYLQNRNHGTEIVLERIV